MTKFNALKTESILCIFDATETNYFLIPSITYIFSKDTFVISFVTLDP